MRTILWTILILTILVHDAEARPLVVVVDAGHGGTNLGARSALGVQEKDVTLFVTRALASILGKTHGVRVVLTREADDFVTLSERVRIANRARADFFLSIHCNASPGGNQRGHEIFVLSPEGVRSQEAPTARRPIGELISDPPRAIAMEVDAAVGDLRRKGLRRMATEYGRAILSSISGVLGTEHDRGLQEGRFDVLMGLEMPGVLVELGFLDHPEDSKLLMNRALLVRLASAMAGAILRHAAQRIGPRVRAKPPRKGAAGHPQDQEPPPDRRKPSPFAPPRAIPARPVVAFDQAA
ncbi:MAG: N-acetylmuramoyl-L-alanine amidase [Polyangia bacterium]|nr:N-acetylmuramoyl-L-alanine amidase [Polyangia bacterium]